MSLKTLHFLLVEPSPSGQSEIEEMLSIFSNEVHKIEWIVIEEALAALELLKTTHFDLLIVSLPLFIYPRRTLWKELHSLAGATPILTIGEQRDEKTSTLAIHLGAEDYIPKSEYSPTHLWRAILHALERHKMHEKFKELLFADELTRLYNRRGFLTLLTQQISLSKRLNKGFLFFQVDLDELKKINDTHGHFAGDSALKGAALCLKNAFRKQDIIGRIGGDEFAVIAINAPEEEGDYLKKVVHESAHQYNLAHKHPYLLSLSVGAAFYSPQEDPSPEELLAQADADLYVEKKQKK
ncbi:MAG: putative diguanylate cyclase AdrA [Chlamydiae bacterium]|nr:putative diguanylate cyclase AdrA [Chlamydiota bacterium]